jgi:spore coat protein CotF
MYLTDAKHHEELCIAKYNHYTEAVSDPELKQIFRRAGQQETNHLHTVEQILQGRMPDMTSQTTQAQQTTGGGSTRGGQSGSMTERLSGTGGTGGMGGTAHSGTSMVASHTQYTGQGGLSEEQICNDLLTTEKAVSDMYDSAVFESSNQQLRQTLNHIQKEEQDHAFAIFQFMQKKGWYQTQ